MHQQKLLREVKSYRQEKIRRQEAEWVGLGKEARSAARMEHQEYREVQAGTRDKEGSSGNKGEDKRILKGLSWQ